MSIVPVHRTATVLKPDQTRVLLRPFRPGSPERIAAIITRVLAIPEAEVDALLEHMCAEFSKRHENLHAIIEERYEQVRGCLWNDQPCSKKHQLLIGSYFLAEYSLESAALFNPSIVLHPDQTDLPPDSLRFLLSLRATGEGHISSITFRAGVVTSDHDIVITPPSGLLSEPRQVPNPRFEKALFRRRLDELGRNSDFTHRVMRYLEENFTLDALRASLQAEQFRSVDGMTPEEQQSAQVIWMLARSNYEVQFAPEQNVSERILFPATPAQRNGIEDARFVRFTDDDGSIRYYATFTAYDGVSVLPELLETNDFLRFRFCTLNGPAARNKGMALFPRKIDGRYAMLSRQDNESISLMFSDNVHFWNDYTPLLLPAFPWELIQIGNCGSPLETPAGWLVISHGVGPMRKYCLGAFLLDLHDPSRVIGRLREPLLQPNRDEREGYVPNVLYSCGALLHGDILILPYGLADHATGFATLSLSALLGAME
jgi:predicted GH43/DUF377 family glycosyl hydrolase